MRASPVVMVGIAELRVATTGYRIRTTGLGSCIGLTLFDPVSFIGGMVHIMLPASDISRDGTLNKAKYADTGIVELIHGMVKMGAKSQRLEAKMAGGAQMFEIGKGGSERLRIGTRNIEECKNMLSKLSIGLKAEDTGGAYGRTIELDVATGRLFIKTVLHGTKVI